MLNQLFIGTDAHGFRVCIAMESLHVGWYDFIGDVSGNGWAAVTCSFQFTAFKLVTLGDSREFKGRRLAYTNYHRSSRIFKQRKNHISPPCSEGCI